MPNAKAIDFAKELPTKSDPNSPGPLVKAIADSWLLSMPARFYAVSTTGMMFCRCARDASSGTTPPYSAWTFCPAITFDRMTFSSITAAEVSSQEDSIPRIYIVGLRVYGLVV